MGEYFDISPLVSSQTAVFPGDQPFTRALALSMEKGDHLDLSAVTTTVHIGAHADAPSHYRLKGQSIESRSLDYYLGPCQVIHLKLQPAARIYPKDINQPILAPRILLATNSFPDPNVWVNDFNSLSPELVFWLRDQGVRTVGIDTPSVDPADSKKLESHTAIAECDLAVLEGPVLTKVPDGVYNLIALPLRWQGFEASPVRAILLKTKT